MADEQTRARHEALGAKLEALAAQGVISDTSLLRICALAARLSLEDIREEQIVRALRIMHRERRHIIEAALIAMQKDPMLAVRTRGAQRGQRTNHVHHVDFYTSGHVAIDRYGQELRVYQPTASSMDRLERATLMWSRRPPNKHISSRLRSRAMAPMRRMGESR